MGQFQDTVVFVTGGSRGIGRAIAEAFAAEGATLAVLATSEEGAERGAAACRDAGATATAHAADVSDAGQVKAAMDAAVEAHGRIDILVNAAGITRDGLLMRMGEEDFRRVLEVNLQGTFNTVKAVTRGMMKRRSGRIINITSVIGLTGNPGQANYAASKAGVIAFSRSVALELASRGITVNCNSRGSCRTAGGRCRRGSLPGLSGGVLHDRADPGRGRRNDRLTDVAGDVSANGIGGRRDVAQTREGHPSWKPLHPHGAGVAFRRGLSKETVGKTLVPSTLSAPTNLT
jgi:3-oxoacyl-[acyl-carrier protein] reductase